MIELCVWLIVLEYIFMYIILIVIKKLEIFVLFFVKVLFLFCNYDNNVVILSR